MKRKRILSLALLLISLLIVVSIISFATRSGPDKPRPAPKMTSETEYANALADFQKRVTLDAYLADGDRDSKWDKDVIKFLKVFLEWEKKDYNNYKWPYTDQDLTNLFNMKCTDPIFLTCLGITRQRLNNDAVTAEKCFTPALEKFQNGRYNTARAHYIPVYMWEHLRMTMGGRSDIENKYKRECVDLIFRALTDGSYEPGDSRFIISTMAPKNTNLFWGQLNNCQDETSTFNLLGDRIKDDKRVDEYVRLVINGYVESERIGLEGEGGQGGPELRAKFILHAKEANRLLERAYKLHPEYPEAPCAMIDVSKWDDNPEGPEKWFWRTLKAQVDYPKAFILLMECYKPMWGGDPERIADTACKLADITRYDTDTPLHACTMMQHAEGVAYHELLQYGNKEYAIKQGFAIIRQPKCIAAMKKVFSGYEKYAPKEKKDRYRTFEIGIADRQNRPTDMAAAFDRFGDNIDGNLTREFEENFHFDLIQARVDVAIFTSPYKAEFKKANKLYTQNKLAESAAIFKRLCAKKHKYAIAEKYAKRAYTALMHTIELDKGEWIDLAPNSTSFLPWIKVNGDSEATQTGFKLSCQKEYSYHKLYSEIPCGNRWELVYDVERTGPMGSFEFQFNTSRPIVEDSDKSPNFTCQSNGEISLDYQQPSARVNGKSEATKIDHFILRKYNDIFQITVNGKVAVFARNPQNITKDSASHFAFTIGLLPESGIEFSNIKLRKLKTEPTEKVQQTASTM